MAKTLKLAKLAKGAKRMIKDQRGNVTMMFAIASIPLLVAGGAALDFDRVVNAKTALQASLDSAVLYAAVSNSTNMTTLTTASRPFLDVNYKGTDATVTSYTISAGATPNSIKATATVTLNTWFMNIVGIPTEQVTTSSEALHVGTGRNINLEVSLVLDNTNSMNTPGSGFVTKPINDLKTAAQNFVTTVMGSSQTPYYTKIAVVPYNNGVNMGTTAMAASARGGFIAGTSTLPGSQSYKFNNASGSTSTFSISNCVTERTGAQAYTDASATVSPVGRQYVGTQNICGVQAMLPLSTDATAINATISAMAANYSTAGQVGIAWGWYTLSPNFGIFTGTSVPAGYDKLITTDPLTKVKKVMILMTDGEYNSAYGNGVISGNPVVSGSYYTTNDLINKAPDNGDVYTQSNAMCTAIKASGVEVYTIAFQLDATYPLRVALLNNCATDAAHALVATDQSQLNTIFQSLAQNLSTLRLTN